MDRAEFGIRNPELNVARREDESIFRTKEDLSSLWEGERRARKEGRKKERRTARSSHRPDSPNTAASPPSRPPPRSAQPVIWP
jgi:hypothetical protein